MQTYASAWVIINVMHADAYDAVVLVDGGVSAEQLDAQASRIRA